MTAATPSVLFVLQLKNPIRSIANVECICGILFNTSLSLNTLALFFKQSAIRDNKHHEKTPLSFTFMTFLMT